MPLGFGGLFGVGIEHAFWNSLSAKLEYNYLTFGSETQALTAAGTLTVAGPADVSLDTHIVKLGLNYRFGWP